MSSEIRVKMYSALGLSYGEMVMPREMKDGLIEAYLSSGITKQAHLFIDGEQVKKGEPEMVGGEK